MERHCTAHLKRGVRLGEGILNCLEGKGCSGRRDGARRQARLRCEHRRSIAPVFLGSLGGCSSRERGFTESRGSHPPKKLQIWVFAANGGIVVLFPSTPQISYRTLSAQDTAEQFRYPSPLIKVLYQHQHTSALPIDKTFTSSLELIICGLQH